MLRGALLPTDLFAIRRSLLAKLLFSSSNSRGNLTPYNYDTAWRRNLEAAQRYLQKYNEIARIPDEKIRAWLYKQRCLLQRNVVHGEENSLSGERQERLESLGLKLFPRQDAWERYYSRVQEFYRKHGAFPYDFEKENLSKEDSKLVWWCRRQRDNRKRGHDYLTKEQESKLLEIGFCFNAFDAAWMHRYRELIEYHKYHGDCMIPLDYVPNPELARWVSEQRVFYKRHQQGKKCSLTKERIALLDRLGFSWDPFQDKWMNRYSELQEYVRLNGKGSIPSLTQNQILRRWIERQRLLKVRKRKGERSSLTDEREKLLDELYFPWL